VADGKPELSWPPTVGAAPALSPSFRTQAAGAAPLFHPVRASPPPFAIPSATEWLTSGSDGAAHVSENDRRSDRAGGHRFTASGFAARVTTATKSRRGEFAQAGGVGHPTLVGSECLAHSNLRHFWCRHRFRHHRLGHSFCGRARQKCVGQQGKRPADKEAVGKVKD